MELFENIVITDVKNPCVAHFEKNQHSQMKDRPYYGLAICISGRNQYTMNGKTFYLDSGHAMLLPNHGCYDIHSLEDGSFPFIDFTCENFDCPEICIFPLEDAKSLLKDYDTIKNLFLFNESRLKILSLFYKILNKVSKIQRYHHNPLHPAIQYIEQNISNPYLTNTVLANELDISEVYLRKLFSTHYNTSPRQYILSIRIAKAQQLLVDTMLTITAIAELCGFSSLYHFCRSFKQKTGITPSAYANQNKIFEI